MLIIAPTDPTMIRPQDLANVVFCIQEAHRYVALSKFDKARAICGMAVHQLNELLQHEKDPNFPTAVRLGHYAMGWFSKLSLDPGAVLDMSKKLQWLSSTIYGAQWTPVIQFGQGLLSMDIAACDVQPMAITLPDFCKEFTCECKEVEATPGLDGFGDLCQDLLPNCSFVLSLLAIHELGLGKELEKLVIYNKEVAKVKLHINGCARELHISTELPFVRPPHEDRFMFVRSSSNEKLLWPALIEKAYLVAMGDGYNFSGSNMAQDIYMLLGWPPEVRKISQMSLALLGEFWTLKEKGLVTLGIGTGLMSESLASQLKVVPGHDYVICGYTNEKLVLKNPWVGRSGARLLEVDASVFGNFTYLYLNWNVDELYKHSTSMSVICNPLKSEVLLLGRPQYSLVNDNDEKEEVGIAVEQFLLTQEHITPYSVDVFEKAKGKVVYPTQYVMAAGGKVITSRGCFMKLELAPKSEYTVVISGPQTKELFLVKLWSNSNKVKFSKAVLQYPHKNEIEDSWGSNDNGGHWALELYIDNPQWEIEVKKRVRKMFVGLSCDDNADVNFHILHVEKSKSLRKIRNFDKSKLLFCDDYSPRIHHHELHDVEPGKYRLVVSSYDANFKGHFRLLVMNDGDKDAVTLEKVPKALGLYNVADDFEWKNRNRFRITLRSSLPVNEVVVKLQAGKEPQTLSLYRPAMRASIFDGLTQEPVVINNKWNDSVYGVFVDGVLKKPEHDYILLVERFETGEGTCRVSLGSSSKLSIKGEDN